MNGILTKYIIKEVSVPFILTLTVLTATLLMGKVIRIIEIAVNNNIGAGFAFNFILYAVPTVLTYIVPSAFLIALLITTTRFSSDNEIQLSTMRMCFLYIFHLLPGEFMEKGNFGLGSVCRWQDLPGLFLAFDINQ